MSEEITTIDEQEKEFPELVWIGRMTRMMDSRFRVPGTSLRFGLDPLFGLVPFLGDIIGLLISSLMVMAMVRHGISGKVVILMLLNIAFDFLLGFIPLFGDAFDFVHRANTRNFRLLKAHYEEGAHQGSGWWIILSIFLAIILLVVGLIWLAVTFLAWTYDGVMGLF
jgi:hypothetical protein